jgi:acetolactate synthase-1/2/3 large subunit
MKETGAKILINALLEEGVEVVFGIPGGAVLPIADAFYQEPKIKFILTRHEQGAAHMADGYARATGKVGVCLATSGPGATNLTTGIATAYMDSVPLVVFTGQVATKVIGNDAFQEVDTTGITRPITKYNFLVTQTEKLASVIKEAFYIASTGRPGPVVIDIPVDVSKNLAEYKYPEKVEIRGYKPTYKGHAGQIKKAAELISQASQPIIYGGGGIIISGANNEVVALAERIDTPVALTLLGLGGFPASHSLFLGMLGMHGARYTNYAISEADLIIAIGARFDDRVTGKLETFAPRAKIIHIDIDPSSISKNVPVTVPIVGDAKEILKELILKIKPKRHQDWWKKIRSWQEKYPLTYSREGKLKPQYVVEQIYELTKGEAIITTEVGQNQMWAAQYYKFNQPRQFLSSGGLGTMGYGFPAAIGAKIGQPDKIVIDIAGDGSFQMNIQELTTCVGYNIPVKVAILNNGYFGMVRQWQELFYGKRYALSELGKNNPDFVKVAEAYGAVGFRVKEWGEVKETLRKALKCPKPVVIDFEVEPFENVFPMVPSGASLTEMIGGIA